MAVRAKRKIVCCSRRNSGVFSFPPLLQPKISEYYVRRTYKEARNDS